MWYYHNFIYISMKWNISSGVKKKVVPFKIRTKWSEVSFSDFFHLLLSCLTLCNPMYYSMPGFPVLHYLLEFAQTHVHWVSDAIQPSHLSPHPLLLLPSVFTCIRVFSSESAVSIRWPSMGASASASVLPINIQGWFPLGLTGLISLQSRGLSKSLLQHHNSKASIL